MKKILSAVIATIITCACGTPSPATNLPSDSLMKKGQPAPDSLKIDSSRNN